MQIILITSGTSRIQLLHQSIQSLVRNAADWSKHELIIVHDGDDGQEPIWDAMEIFIHTSVGASRARNIGASSVPKYRRQEHVCFVDNDFYACKGWDERLHDVARTWPHAIVSAHAHPYNHTEIASSQNYIVTDVLSTVQMMMPWWLWDKVGWFTEPGGAGGSEDVDYCRRTTDKECQLVLTRPHCFIHTGLHSSTGKPIVGIEQVVERNRQLERLYGLEGKVRYA